MAILTIIKEGDPILRKTSRPVEAITPRILQLLDDMIDTMRKADGCALAAVQVGVLRRVVVIEVEEGEVIELNYFSFACTATRKNKDGSYSPENAIMEGIYRSSSEAMGKYTGKTKGGFVIDES